MSRNQIEYACSQDHPFFVLTGEVPMCPECREVVRPEPRYEGEAENGGSKGDAHAD